MTQIGRKIPKSAVKPLAEYCKNVSEETGRPAAEVFREFLELMKKHADYFFGEPWPEKVDKPVWFSDEDVGFIDGSESYEDSCERFRLVCLRRNMSMEGFDSEGFTWDFEFYGRLGCADCAVLEATGARKKVKRVEEHRREIEGEMRQEEPSWMTKRMSEYLESPDVVKSDGMLHVKLRLYEEMGGAEKKSCEVRNRYRCPYGEKSVKFIKDGGLLKDLWHYVEWYDHYWNPSRGLSLSAQDMKWYHYDEPSILDVTSYEDILEAVKDGRMEKIMREYKKYVEETG